MKKISFQNTIPTVVLLVFVPLIIFSCSRQTTLKRIKRDGVVSIGISNDVPYANVDKDGRVTGEGPE